MTSLWGPLGWMTLHSVSLLYPEKPSQADKQIVKRFIDLLRDTISCPHCQSHFKIIYENYIRYHPEWADSRFDLFLFITRAHNTVNNRLSKPKPNSVQGCLDAYRSATKNTTGTGFRRAYINYLLRNYASQMSAEGYMNAANVREMQRINDEYWNSKTDESTNSFQMDANVLELIDETSGTRSLMTSRGTIMQVATKELNVGFRGGRFRLTHK